MSTLTRRVSCSVGIAALLAACIIPAGCGGGNPPPPTTFTIGGTVTKLAGMNGGLVLQDGTGMTLPVSANGSFSFPSAVPSGTAYNVTISAQPSNPTQTCGVVNGSGTVQSDVTNITVDCGHNEWAWMSGAATINLHSTYGTMGVAAPGNTPGGRQYAATWTDKSGNLWLFGGYGYDSVGTLLPMNDLWKFSGGEWTWVSGSNLGGQSGVYGTQGVSASGNIPGSRLGAQSWMDASGNFWLLGGYGLTSSGGLCECSDQWKYASGEWTWVLGSQACYQRAVYGTQGVAGAGNFPGARQYGVTWTDKAGNAWLFGGSGIDAAGNAGFLNDLWKFSNGQWTWIGGSEVANPTSVYGTLGAPAPGNGPGGRFFLSPWQDANGNFWLFGGYGAGTGGLGNLNDFWMYEP
jgi:hypothetical protein